MPKRGESKYVKTAVSLRDDISDYAKFKASEMFGGNFSAYISNLICQDMQGMKLYPAEALKEQSAAHDIVEVELPKDAISAIDLVLDYEEPFEGAVNE